MYALVVLPIVTNFFQLVRLVCEVQLLVRCYLNRYNYLCMCVLEFAFWWGILCWVCLRPRPHEDDCKRKR